MSRPLSDFFLFNFTARWPVLIYAATWTALLSATVALASFSPEVAFVWAISPSSSFSKRCNTDTGGSVRVPLDIPGDILCLPSSLFRQSPIDLIVPPLFAAVIVAASACLVRAVGLWETDEAR